MISEVMVFWLPLYGFRAVAGRNILPPKKLEKKTMLVLGIFLVRHTQETWYVLLAKFNCFGRLVPIYNSCYYLNAFTLLCLTQDWGKRCRRNCGWRLTKYFLTPTQFPSGYIILIHFNFKKNSFRIRLIRWYEITNTYIQTLFSLVIHNKILWLRSKRQLLFFSRAIKREIWGRAGTVHLACSIATNQ